MRAATKQIKTGKAAGPDNILVELWKLLEWSVLVLIFRNKGDVQNSGN